MLNTAPSQNLIKPQKGLIFIFIIVILISGIPSALINLVKKKSRPLVLPKIQKDKGVKSSGKKTSLEPLLGQAKTQVPILIDLRC